MLTKLSISLPPHGSRHFGFEGTADRRLPKAIFPLLLAQAAILWVLIQRSWFFADDFLFLNEAREADLSIEFLRRPLFEHFSPVHRFGDWVFIRAFGLNWSAALLVLVLLATACTLAFAALASQLFGSRRLVLALTALYGTSLFFTRNAAWWTGGTHLLTATLFSLLTLQGYVLWVRRGRPAWLVGSLSVYVLALLSHEQALLLPAYAVLVRMLLLPCHPSKTRVLVRDWRVWLAYTVPTALSAANFVLWYRHDAERPELDLMLRFFKVSLFEGVLPTFVGLKIPEAVWVSRQWTIVISLVSFAMLVVVSVRRNAEAWRAWAFFVCSFVLAALPLGLGRVLVFGPSVGLEPRYQMAIAYLGLLGIGAAFNLAPSWRFGQAGRGRRRAVVAAVAVLYLVVHVRGADRLQDALWEPVSPRRFFANLDADIDQRASAERVGVFPGVVPEEIVPSWLFPFNRYERALTLARPSLRVGEDRVAFEVDVDGHLSPAVFAPDHVIKPSTTAYRLAGLSPLPSGSGSVCGSTATTGTVFTPLAHTGGEARILAVVYRSTESPIRVGIEIAPGQVSELVLLTHRGDGRKERYLQLPAAPFTGVVLDQMGPGSLCVDRIELGAVVRTR